MSASTGNFKQQMRFFPLVVAIIISEKFLRSKKILPNKSQDELPKLEGALPGFESTSSLENNPPPQHHFSSHHIEKSVQTRRIFSSVDKSKQFFTGHPLNELTV